MSNWYSFFVYDYMLQFEEIAWHTLFWCPNHHYLFHKELFSKLQERTNKAYLSSRVYLLEFFVSPLYVTFIHNSWSSRTFFIDNIRPFDIKYYKPFSGWSCTHHIAINRRYMILNFDRTNFFSSHHRIKQRISYIAKLLIFLHILNRFV